MEFYFWTKKNILLTRKPNGFQSSFVTINFLYFVVISATAVHIATKLILL